MSPVLRACVIVPLLLAAAATAGAAPAADPSGHWEGAIETPGQPLVIKIDLKQGGGAWTGTIDIPQQGAKGLNLAGVSVAGDSVSFAIGGIGGRPVFRGVQADDGTIRGDFSQNGMTFPFHLGRGTVAPTRPQEPVPPFPYRSEDVGYASGDVHLAATLTLPEGEGPFPAAVLLTGSGPENRDEEIFGHKPFLVLADYLTRHGIAVLRADDRGVGGSTGSEATATISDFADDALAGIGYLRTRPEIARGRIGLIGHSEGGLIACLAATRKPDEVAYIVLMASPGVPLGQVIERQVQRLLTAAGADSAMIAGQVAETKIAMDLAASGADSATIRRSMEKEVRARAAAAGAPVDEKRLASTLDSQLPGLMSPGLRYALKLDPRALLSRITCPVLALNGTLDLQVDAEQSLPAIADALAESGDEDVTIKRLPGLNHLFQKAQTGLPSEYGAIAETMDPEVLKTIGDWITARFGPK